MEKGYAKRNKIQSLCWVFAKPFLMVHLLLYILLRMANFILTLILVNWKMLSF